MAPLGLNTDSFLAQQQDMSEHFISSITHQLQGHIGADVEALVVGIDNGNAQIYSIDKHGTSRCFDDVGFAAIGIGAWHARSWLMQTGYVNTQILAPALASIFSAKRAAEIAPGVGCGTESLRLNVNGLKYLQNWKNYTKNSKTNAIP